MRFGLSLATQVAYGKKENDHSVFTYHLMEGLRGASIDREGTVTPHSLGEYVYDKVTAAVKQKPVIKTEASGKIILADYRGLTARSLQSESDSVKVDISSIVDEGNQCAENFDYENAIRLYDRAIVLNPRDHHTYNHKGKLLFSRGKYEEAIKAYDGAIAANSKHRVAYNGKGDALFELSIYKEAIESYDKALEIYPNYFEVLRDKGLALDRLERYRRSHTIL